MKKLNKILMPIVGLSTIAATTIPLAACNKNVVTDGVEVTADEWKNALIYLSANKEGATWKSSSEDAVTGYVFEDGKLESYGEYYDIAFNDNLATMSAIGAEEDTQSGEIKVEYSNASIVRKNDMYFKYSYNSKTDKVRGLIERESFIQSYLTDIVVSIGGQDAFDFDKDAKAYVFDDMTKIEGDDAYCQAKIRFNSNKQITYVNSHCFILNTDGSLNAICDVVLHPQYDNVKVEIDQEYIDRAARHTFTLSSEGKCEIKPNTWLIEGTTPSYEDEGATIKIPNKAIKVGDTLTVVDKAYPAIPYLQDVTIWNGETRLINGTDYTYGGSGDKANIITFNKAIDTTTLDVRLLFASGAYKNVTLDVTLASA